MNRFKIQQLFTILLLLVGGLLLANVSYAGACGSFPNKDFKPDKLLINGIKKSKLRLTVGTPYSVAFTTKPKKTLAPGGYRYTVTQVPSSANVSYSQVGSTGAFTFTGLVPTKKVRMQLEIEAYEADGVTLSGCKSNKKIDIKVITGATGICLQPTMASFPTFTAAMNSTFTINAVNIASRVRGGTPPYIFTNTVTTVETGAGGLSAFDNNTGAFTYQTNVVPIPANWTGTYTFDFHVSSSCDLTKVTTVPITISVVDPATGACAAPTIPTLGTFRLSAGGVFSGAPNTTGGRPPYIYAIDTPPTHGTLVIHDAVTGSYTYTADAGYNGADSFAMSVASSACASLTSTATAGVTISNNVVGTYSPTPGSGNLITNGAIIIDNTPNPGTPGISTNMSTNLGGKQFGVANAFNIDSIQVMQRETSVVPHELYDEAGYNNSNSTSFDNYGTANQANFFANGQHLFDLDRLRVAADWMTANIPPSAGACTLPATVSPKTLASPTYDDAGPTVPIGLPVGSCHPAGTYGTISWHQFLDNIANNRTMYGIVRVLVPLQLGTSNSSNNALNENIGSSNIYGFCSNSVGLCANAPTGNTNIKPANPVGGNVTPSVNISANSQVRMRGVLMLDFVNNAGDAVYPTAGSPIGLDHLPFQPRDIYFKVSVPINVNGAHDLDGDGAMDNMDYINGISSGITCSALPCSTAIPSAALPDSTTIDSTKVPREAVAAWNYQFGTHFTDATDTNFVNTFNTANLPNRYHTLMPSGYAQGFADAFAELNLTAQQWNDLDFTVPPGVNMNAPLKVHDIRSDAFEDLPVYLYTGGLVDMHHHLNVSGLMYVPQALEQEAKKSNTRQYTFGGVVVRDGFFLEANTGSITLISSDPASFASIRVNQNAIAAAMLSTAVSNLHDDGSGGASIGGVGINGGAASFITGSGDSSIFGISTSGAVGKMRWIEVRPQ